MITQLAKIYLRENVVRKHTEISTQFLPLSSRRVDSRRYFATISQHAMYNAEGTASTTKLHSIQSHSVS